jgi:hypothetical protein
LQFDRLYGRAILGGLCNGAEHAPWPRGLCDRVVVDSDPRPGDGRIHRDPSSCVFPGNPVSVSGWERTRTSWWTNPFVRRSDSVAFRCAPGQVRVYRDAAEGRGNP